MKKEFLNPTPTEKKSLSENNKYDRRKFLSTLSMSIGAAGAISFTSCAENDWYDQFRNTNKTGATLDFKDDIGILNYAYALEQLEAAFYTAVAANPPSGFSTAQKNFFTDIQMHEIAHREFFKKALGTNAIGNLEVDFSSINFADGNSVLAAAKTFEDIGVAAYNGAGVRIKTDAYLVIAGQIVSVEARHAAWVRDQISNGSFADLNSLTSLGANNTGGLDGALTPDKVLPLAAPFIKTKINAINL